MESDLSTQVCLYVFLYDAHSPIERVHLVLLVALDHNGQEEEQVLENLQLVPIPLVVPAGSCWKELDEEGGDDVDALGFSEELFK